MFVRVSRHGKELLRNEEAARRTAGSVSRAQIVGVHQAQFKPISLVENAGTLGHTAEPLTVPTAGILAGYTSTYWH
jgi:hypothetical protein